LTRWITRLLGRGGRRADRVHVLWFERAEPAAPFARRVEHLAQRYPIVSAAQLLEALEGGRALPSGALLLAFREARSFAQVSWPILRRRRLPAALFLGPDAYGSHGSTAGFELAFEELQRLADQGASLGLDARAGSRAAPASGLRHAFLQLERLQPTLPRLLAHPDGPVDDERMQLALDAGADLAFTALPGANDLCCVDRLRLRSLAADVRESPEELGARISGEAAPGARSTGLERLAPEERRTARRLRSERLRLRYVRRSMEAVLAASLGPRPRLLATLGALRSRAPRYERLRDLVRLAIVALPPLARWLQRALLEPRRLPFRASALELLGSGSAATVFRIELESQERPLALKVYRWTLGLSAAELARVSRRHRARHEELRRWFGESVLPTHFLVLNGPLRALPVAVCLQERLPGSADLLALSDDEILRRLRARPGLRAEFVRFAHRLLEVRGLGFLPDLLGSGNLLLVERGTETCLRLVDFGLLDLRCGSGQEERASALVLRFETLLRGMGQ
jgi:hypothetical protein